MLGVAAYGIFSEESKFCLTSGCGSKPMGSHFGVGEFTTHFRTYFSGDWDVHWKYDLDFDSWPSGAWRLLVLVLCTRWPLPAPRGWHFGSTTTRVFLIVCWSGCQATTPITLNHKTMGTFWRLGSSVSLLPCSILGHPSPILLVAFDV